MSPLIKSGTTLVPLRATFTALGASVDWDGSKNMIHAELNRAADGLHRVVDLRVSEASALVGGLPYSLRVAAEIRDGRTLVPLRFVGEALGAVVRWDGEQRLITITSPGRTPTPPGATPLSVDQIRWNSRWPLAVDSVGFEGLVGSPYRRQVPTDALATIANALQGRQVWLDRTGQGTGVSNGKVGWIWTDDGQLLNAVLVREGYAEVDQDVTGPYANVLRQMQAEAIQLNRGLWRPEGAGEDDVLGLVYPWVRALLSGDQSTALAMLSEQARALHDALAGGHLTGPGGVLGDSADFSKVVKQVRVLIGYSSPQLEPKPPGLPDCTTWFVTDVTLYGPYTQTPTGSLTMYNQTYKVVAISEGETWRVYSVSPRSRAASP